MGLDELVFRAITRRWETRADDIAFFAKHFWHSFEEWLNWEAVLGCRDAEMKHVWPKSPYAHKNQDRSLPKTIRFKDSGELSDLMVENEGERVVVEVKVVHGQTGATLAKLEHDRTKLATDCPEVGKTVLPLLVVISMYHPENPQNNHQPPWFEEWVMQSQSTMGVPLKYGFELPQHGLFEVRGWKIEPRQTSSSGLATCSAPEK